MHIMRSSLSFKKPNILVGLFLLWTFYEGFLSTVSRKWGALGLICPLIWLSNHYLPSIVMYLTKAMAFTLSCSSSSSQSLTERSGTKVAVLPNAGLPPQTQEPRLQFYQGWIGAVASHCFSYPTLCLASEQILKDLKRSQGHQRGREESGFG